MATIALASVGLGIEQLVSGNLYLYDITNLGTPVGLFSNVNHQADFIVCALILFLGNQATYQAENRPSVLQLPRFAAYAVILFFIVGIILCGSVAGMGLLAIALYGAWHISNRSPRSGLFALWVLPVSGILGAAIYVYAGAGVADIFVDTKVPGLSRADFWRIGAHLVVQYFPFGSGLGTFPDVYHLWENPKLVDRTYVNHAHNDYLELIIETGVFGLLALTALGAWFFSRVVRLNRQESSPRLWSCVLLIVVVALHSLVDYPLRTAALSSVAAAALGFLARGRLISERGGRK